MKVFQIWILLLIFIQIETVISFKCGTDSLKIKPKLLNEKQNDKTSSILKDTAYTPIKMAFDFTTLQKPSSMSSATFDNVKSILRDTRIEFSKFLQVQHSSIDLEGYLDRIMNDCGLSTIGAGYEDFLIDNDIIIFPQFDSLSTGVIAAAAPCILANNYRPVAGVVYINTNINFDKTNIEFYMKNILLHEITHILVFHPALFDLLHMNTTSGGISYIRSTNAVQKAQNHFGCSSLASIPLENQGGSGSAGSHWESRYMLGDYMISTDYPDAAISDITLALFEDTGFYKVKEYSGGLFKFGKNKGCSFFSEVCVSNGVANFEEFCTTSGEGKCSSSRAIKSSCYSSGYSTADNCAVAYESHSSSSYYQRHCRYGTASESLEVMGESSFCFMSSLNQGTTAVSSRPVCYAVSCDTDNSKIVITVGSTTISCNDETVSNVSGFSGSIICPKYSELCASPTSDKKVYNDMYNIFTKKASDDHYSYPTSFDDYTGSALDNDDDDGDVTAIPRNSNNNIRINVILLTLVILLL